LTAFGVCERSQANATAVRFYVTLAPGSSWDFDALGISYDRSICPGYGWIFPGPDRTFNVGVGYFHDGPRSPAITNLRRLLERFLETFRPARELMRASARVSALGGAPLRTGLSGAALSRPGLIVIGDAAGLTYPISGEGIGKAMESGILAGETIRDGLRGQRSAGTVEAEYARAIRARLSQRFRAYASAQGWVARPHLVDFLAWRANRGRYVRRQIEGLVNETADPRSILSMRGILRSLFS
jgi:flavin-dependent dehydrogenase